MSKDLEVQVVTEEDLLKSLNELEGQVEIKQEVGEPKVVISSLEKSTSTTLAELASGNLQKALDVSEVLDEVVTLVGVHVDRSLESLEKSIHAGAMRDQAIIRVMTEMKKSIDGLGAVVEKLMAAPAAPAASRPVTTQSGEVLAKSVGKPEVPKDTKTPQELRKSISAGLLELSKTADQGKAMHFSNAVVKFESSGTISDADMAAALAVGK